MRTMRLVLAGAYRGKSIRLGGYTFTNGVLDLRAKEPAELQKVALYLRRSYQAFPEGDPEIDRINAACEAAEKGADDGERDVPEASESGATGEVRGDVQSDGASSSEGDTDVSGGDDNAAAGDAGPVPVRDGYTDPRVQQEGEGPEQARLRKAVARLDPELESHWTRSGLPAIAAVESILGSGQVTRQLVEEVAAGWTREVAANAPDPEEG